MINSKKRPTLKNGNDIQKIYESYEELTNQNPDYFKKKLLDVEKTKARGLQTHVCNSNSRFKDSMAIDQFCLANKKFVESKQELNQSKSMTQSKGFIKNL